MLFFGVFSRTEFLWDLIDELREKVLCYAKIYETENETNDLKI